MGSLFGKEEKQKKQQKQQQSSYPTKSQFPSQKKELSEGEKMRMKLQHNRDELRNKRKQIDLQIETYEKEIRTLIQSNKRDQAKFVLQRKLLYDKFLDNIMEKEQIIEKSIISVDQMQSDKEMADIINQTNQVMKDIQSSIDQDKLRDAFADMQEQKQKNDEMNQMYQQYKVGDEDEINELYGKYEQQVCKTTQPKQQQFVPLPQQQQQQQFVPLPQQQEQQQQQQHQQQQESNEYTDKLAMLE
ncbi:unnamed protein product (macronuclear) [Paramecium tetraurelia]|uniref:SNF7 family protein n=1 Tax=Paramecium tetraurelia TaxID=5888 RepID=A0DP44_PARTE|nr:uncharacterized protein GSPATT00018992001 [Paramecium tetraurelia]CAK84811.1 unnamed protein product [Paramecium tetraurelia]|eukprot:XP_001452208.1 hypothetical protein (macronuclear) [Paramecium tetraurelia strain d4-2]